MGALGVAVLVGACAARPPRAGEPGRLVVPLEADLAEAARVVAWLARRAEVLYLGELHDNPHHHRVQARVLEALVEAGMRPAVAFEMLPEGQQALLDAVVASDAGPEEVERRLGWRARGWPDFNAYWPLFALARRHGLLVVAADLDPGLARRIAREGLAAVGLARDALASRLPPDPAREAGLARTIQEAHCHLLPEARLPLMVAAWHARNVTMARRIASALERAAPVTVIVGRGHQAPGGLPAQLAALRPATRQLMVELWELGPGDAAEAILARATGDVVWFTPATSRPDPCAVLRARPDGSGGPRGETGPERWPAEAMPTERPP